MLVDDVSTNLKCIDMILRDQYKVTTARSGVEALKFLETMVPDLILLDIYMQGMDGYEVLEKIKDNPDTADIPVILITADAKEETERRGLALGAADFIHKPFEPAKLLERIRMIWKAGEE